MSLLLPLVAADLVYVGARRVAVVSLSSKDHFETPETSGTSSLTHLNVTRHENPVDAVDGCAHFSNQMVQTSDGAHIRCCKSDGANKEPCAGEVLTKCHTARNIAERKLVISRGGDVPECSKDECPRVNGLIEVTRSLGDRYLKPILSCTPDVHRHTVNADDGFLVAGSDGLFDFVDNETVVWCQP